MRGTESTCKQLRRHLSVKPVAPPPWPFLLVEFSLCFSFPSFCNPEPHTQWLIQTKKYYLNPPEVRNLKQLDYSRALASVRIVFLSGERILFPPLPQLLEIPPHAQFLCPWLPFWVFLRWMMLPSPLPLLEPTYEAGLLSKPRAASPLQGRPWVSVILLASFIPLLWLALQVYGWEVTPLVSPPVWTTPCLAFSPHAVAAFDPRS